MHRRAIFDVQMVPWKLRKLWREFFDASTFIYGIDIDPSCPTFTRDAHMKSIILDTNVQEVWVDRVSFGEGWLGWFPSWRLCSCLNVVWYEHLSWMEFIVVHWQLNLHDFIDWSSMRLYETHMLCVCVCSFSTALYDYLCFRLYWPPFLLWFRPRMWWQLCMTYALMSSLMMVVIQTFVFGSPSKVCSLKALIFWVVLIVSEFCS